MPPDVSIHEAAGQGDIEAVKQLLAAGADLNEKDEDFRWTPLQHAIMSGQLEVVRILIKYNSDIHVRDDNGCTLLHLAQTKEIAELLIGEGADINASGPSKSCPLSSAVWDGNKEVAEFLIRQGANVNSTDILGATPLHEAASAAHKELVKILITYGANVNAIDRCGMSPLYKAARMGKVGMVELLLSLGAKVNIIDNEYNWTPLNWVKARQLTELEKILRKHGAKTAEELKTEATSQ